MDCYLRDIRVSHVKLTYLSQDSPNNVANVSFSSMFPSFDENEDVKGYTTPAVRSSLDVK